MADIDGVDERVAEQAADEADDAGGSQHLRRRKRIAGGRRALDIVHRFDEIVDAEGNRGDQDDAEEFEAREHMVDRRQRNRKAEMRNRVAENAKAEAAITEAENIRTPGDQRARRDGDEAARHAAEIAYAAEPIGEDDGQTDDADQRRFEDKQARPHRDEGDRNAGERAEQRRARRDLADDRRDEAADHQYEALHEHPGEARLPGLNGI